MKICITEDTGELTVALAGRLDTLTSAELEDSLGPELDSADRLIFDFEDLEYISSAGLRVLLSALKLMEDRDGMVLRSVKPAVMEVFDITGMTEFLAIE